MNGTFFDGHDELYHHAKFGGDLRCQIVLSATAIGAITCIFLPARSSVLAMATWLGGWLSVTAGIVCKRQNLS